MNPVSLTLTSNPSPTHLETGLQHLLLFNMQGFKALLIHPKKGEPFSLEFNLQRCNNHLKVLKRRVPCSKTGRDRGENGNREEKQKVQVAPAAELLVTKLSTKGETAGTGTELFFLQGNSSCLSSGEMLRSDNLVSVWLRSLF